LKIADFGFATFLRPSELADTICGSPMYMAPEIKFQSPYSVKVDLWSLGVILNELITGKTPFPAAKTPFELSEELKMRGAQPFSLPVDVSASEDLRNLVPALLTIDQEKRIDLGEFLNHPFLRAQRTSSDESTEGGQNAQKERRSSFLGAEGSVDDQKAEAFLCDARESADVVVAHPSGWQMIVDFLVFE
jgi:serine/threonine-protein kinase ULK/ATG1